MEEFVYLRPVFKCILVASILVMLIVLRQKKELINEFSLWFISILCVGVSAITLFMSGFIVDEYSLGGDAQSFSMFIAIGCISGLNFIIYCFVFHVDFWEKCKFNQIKKACVFNLIKFIDSEM